MSLLNMTPSSTCFAMSLVRTGYWYILISMIALNKSKTILHSVAMWINAVVKFFSRPALQSESSPPWIFSTFAKRFTSISCRKQTRYFSAYQGWPSISQHVWPIFVPNHMFLESCGPPRNTPITPKKLYNRGTCGNVKTSPRRGRTQQFGMKCVCVCVWLKIFGIPKSSYVAPCAHQAWQCRQSSLLGWQGQRSMYQTWGINQNERAKVKQPI